MDKAHKLNEELTDKNQIWVNAEVDNTNHQELKP